MSQLLTITRPDDWHLHLRDGNVLSETVAATARTFGRAIIMPNLMPPVTDADLASQYKSRIIENTPTASALQPLRTL